MSAIYPASCGVCGRVLVDEEESRAHIGPCFMAWFGGAS